MMEDPLIQEAKNFYHKTREMYESCDYESQYPLNNFWGRENMTLMRQIIKDSQSSLQAIHDIQNTFLFSINTSDPIKNKAVDWLLREQKKRGIDIFQMNHSVEESSFSFPDNNVIQNGRILTPDFLRTVNITCEIQKYFPELKSDFSVLEIGAGCGHLARTLSLMCQNLSYVIIDIPEALFFSYLFLKQNFPEAKFTFVTNQEDFSEIKLSPNEFVFVPTMFSNLFHGFQFDLFINTASFGEMKNSVIRHWMDFIQTWISVNRLFTLNRFLNTIYTDGSHDWRLDENECSLLYDWRWNILNWEVEPSFTRSPFVDTQIARYLEICATRPSVESADDRHFLQVRKKRSDNIIREVMDEDWVRDEELRDPVMTRGDNIIVNDLSMSGTLFKLWDSFRLLPQETNTRLMIKYLESLLRVQGKEFEEVFYYEKYYLENLKETAPNEEMIALIKLKINSRKLLPPLIRYSNYKGAPIQVKTLGDYNIVRFNEKFYGLHKALGSIDLAHTGADEIEFYKGKGMFFVGDSVQMVNNRILETIPKITVEGYKGFNVVEFQTKFIAVPQHIGKIQDWWNFYYSDPADRNLCIVRDTLDEALNQIDQSTPPAKAKKKRKTGKTKKSGQG